LITSAKTRTVKKTLWTLCAAIPTSALLSFRVGDDDASGSRPPPAHVVRAYLPIGSGA
jgi:hypothetical protein